MTLKAATATTTKTTKTTVTNINYFAVFSHLSTPQNRIPTAPHLRCLEPYQPTTTRLQQEWTQWHFLEVARMEVLITMNPKWSLNALFPRGRWHWVDCYKSWKINLLAVQQTSFLHVSLGIAKCKCFGSPAFGSNTVIIFRSIREDQVAKPSP